MRRGATRRAGMVGAALALAIVTGGNARADSAGARNNEGNRLYNQKRYDEALKMYTDAQTSRPDAPELHYNIGNVLFRKGEYDKAAEEYLKAQAAADRSLAESATFNRGNALLMQNRLPEAVSSYVQALRQAPGDADAKHNLELALRMMQEQQKQQQQPKQDQKSPDQKDDSSQSQPQPQKGAPDAQQQPSQGKPGEMSQEEANQVLAALREAEKEGIRKHAQAAAAEHPQPEKDW